MSRHGTTGIAFLPLGVDLRGRRCLIVGGGTVGARKAATLVRAGAQVAVVAPKLGAELEHLVEAGTVSWIAEPFVPNQLAGSFLVIAATDDAAVNEEVVGAARSLDVLVCDASAAERSQVIFGALLETGDGTVAVFSDGRDPAGSRRLRDKLASALEVDSVGAGRRQE